MNGITGSPHVYTCGMWTCSHLALDHTEAFKKYSMFYSMWYQVQRVHHIYIGVATDMRASVVPNTKGWKDSISIGELKELYYWQLSVADLQSMREASTLLFTMYRTRWFSFVVRLGIQ